MNVPDPMQQALELLLKLSEFLRDLEHYRDQIDGQVVRANVRTASDGLWIDYWFSVRREVHAISSGPFIPFPGFEDPQASVRQAIKSMRNHCRDFGVALLKS